MSGGDLMIRTHRWMRTRWKVTKIILQSAGREVKRWQLVLLWRNQASVTVRAVSSVHPKTGNRRQINRKDRKIQWEMYKRYTGIHGAAVTSHVRWPQHEKCHPFMDTCGWSCVYGGRGSQLKFSIFTLKPRTSDVRRSKVKRLQLWHKHKSKFLQKGKYESDEVKLIWDQSVLVTCTWSDWCDGLTLLKDFRDDLVVVELIIWQMFHQMFFKH